VTHGYLGGRLQFLEGGGDQVSKAVAPSGAVYYLYADIAWDDHEDGDVRVMVDLYEDVEPHGGLREDFIMAPDGSFVDE